MPDYIYCGTFPPVGANGTQALLLGQFNAIWYPPPHLQPVEGARVWLVHNPNAPVLLGGGRIALTGAGNPLWKNVDKGMDGVVAAAIALGYHGPNGMDFLRLNKDNVMQGHQQPVVNLGAIHPGLNVAMPQQVEVLKLLLPIPE